MAYQAKNFERLLGLQGFSDTLLKNHFTLYQGYVNNFNKLDEMLMNMEKEGKFGTLEFAELNRRLGWEFNGMRLHEYYFENMTKVPMSLESDSQLAKRINSEWGSIELFVRDFKSMGAMRGIGWIVVYYDKLANRLFNVWINEHDVGHFSGCTPVLVMDVFEHAYMPDYGLKKTDYVEAFMAAINWKVANARIPC